MENETNKIDGEAALSRKWQPAPVFLPGAFHGQRSLADHLYRGAYLYSISSHSVMLECCGRELVTSWSPPPGEVFCYF